MPTPEELKQKVKELIEENKLEFIGCKPITALIRKVSGLYWINKNIILKGDKNENRSS